MADKLKDVQAAARQVQARDERRPATAVILGSGLGELVETAHNRTVFAADQLEGYPVPTVEGHKGRLVIGTLEGQVVAFLQGRLHYYEGYTVDQITFPVRLLYQLGARRLIVTNAAGGINPNFAPGTLMFIQNHIHINFVNLLTSHVTEGLPFGRQKAPLYDWDWLQKARALALQLHIPTEVGVYLWAQGPSYETPSEIRAYGLLGADAVGMSTVPEVTQARQLEMKVLGVSTITNRASGLHKGPLLHAEVLATASRIQENLTHLLRRILGLERGF